MRSACMVAVSVALLLGGLGLVSTGCPSGPASGDDDDDDNNGDDDDDTGPVEQGEWCAQLIDCTIEVTPEAVASMLAAYGPNGHCWETAEEAEICEEACKAALKELRQLDPDNIECYHESELLPENVTICEDFKEDWPEFAEQLCGQPSYFSTLDCDSTIFLDCDLGPYFQCLYDEAYCDGNVPWPGFDACSDLYC